MANSYKHLEYLVEKEISDLENENARLKEQLAITQAKLSVYERLASISDSKMSLGFGPPSEREK